MAVTDDLLAEVPASIATRPADAPVLATHTIAVVACVDSGRRVAIDWADAAVSLRRLGADELILVDHAECGRFAPATDGGPAGVESDVKRFVTQVAGAASIRPDRAIRGFTYEVECGRVREVL
jgi:hypothetical protein